MMRKTDALTAIVLLAWFAVEPAHARVRLPPIFSDHAVLQGGTNVPVWGWADAGEHVAVAIAGQTRNAVAGADGAWRVTLDALKLGDGPLTLTVTGRNTITLQDVLVGEVWLCSGQSNMVFPVSKARNFALEQPAARWPRIRLLQSRWIVCSPETVGAFSATAYFFGREIHQQTGLPVGLIERAAGGSPIELWTSWDAQKDVAELKPIFAAAAEAPASSPEAAAQAQSDRKQAAAVEGRQAVAGSKTRPGQLFDDRIAPLIPYAIRGVIWYQGEANSYTVHADLYGRQLAVMIADWRKRWGCVFPFLSVQLPELGQPQTEPGESSGRALVREGVLLSLSLPQTGMAVTLGTGEAMNNHPTNKQEVGRRLAQWALATVYGRQDVVASGPLPSGHTVTSNRVVIAFTHTDGGLVARGGPLKGFAIAGSDQKWVWAEAQIDGATVILSHPSVPAPVAARYAWAGNPAGCNLYNGAGLPATPFRTDHEPLIEVYRH